MQFQSRGAMTPTVTKNLLILNTLVFILTIVDKSLISTFALYFPNSVNFRPYQFVTYMFTHGGFFHFLFNMFALWMFGSMVERYWDRKKYFTFYIVAGFFSAIFHYGIMAYQLNIAGLDAYRIEEIKTASSVVGASGALYGILVAFAFMFPNQRLMLLFPPIPIKAKYLIIALLVFDIFGGLNGRGNTAHFAHVGGAAIGALLSFYWKLNNKLYNSSL